MLYSGRKICQRYRIRRPSATSTTTATTRLVETAAGKNSDVDNASSSKDCKQDQCIVRTALLEVGEDLKGLWGRIVLGEGSHWFMI